LKAIEKRLKHLFQFTSCIEELLEGHVGVAFEQVVAADLFMLERNAGDVVGVFTPKEIRQYVT
jgi:hypothetical protein